MTMQKIIILHYAFFMTTLIIDGSCWFVDFIMMKNA